MHVFFFSMSYVFSLILLAGAFFCLYLGCKLISRSGRAANARTEFSGKFGEYEFTIGAGSVAALVMAISVLWILAAFMARPKVTFTVDSNGLPSWINVVADAEGIPRETEEWRRSSPAGRYEAAHVGATDAAELADLEATIAAERAAAAAAQASAAIEDTVEAADAAADPTSEEPGATKN